MISTLPYLEYLTYLAVILLIGVVLSIISNKLKIPNLLFLILVGIGLNHIYYQGNKLIQFSPLFLTSIAVLALVMIVFDSTSRFKLKEFDTLSTRTLKLTGFFIFFNMIFLTLSTLFIADMPFNLNSVFLALIFSAIMSGTDPGSVLTLFKEKTNRITELLKVEAIINTPFNVLLPFIFLDLMASIKIDLFSESLEQIAPFLKQIITGVGAGIVVGIIIFKIMRKRYSKTFSPLAIFIAALLTYILAENLGGNGVLAVTTLGLFFGNVYIKEKTELTKFSSTLTNSLEILVFVLVGFIVDIPLNLNFFLMSFVLFIIYILIRFLAVIISFLGEDYNIMEKVFMSLNVTKGIAVAVVALILATYNIEGFTMISHLIILFMLYSVILSSAAIRFSKYFIKITAQPEKIK